MKTKNDTVKLILALFAFSTLFLLFSLVYSSIKTSSLKDLTEERELFEKSQEHFSILQNNMEDWENVEKEYLKFKDTMMLRFEDFSKFRSKLEGIFRKNGLLKNKFSLGYKQALNNEFIKVKIQMKLKGTYDSLKEFLYDIRNMGKTVFFKSIRISGTESDLTGDFSMEVYLVR